MNVVITSGFPFGGEPFLESECNYMPEDTVFFALSPVKEINCTKFNAYKVPNKKINITSIFYAFCGLFSPICIEEIIDMCKRRKLSIRNLMKMYAVYGYGTRCYKFILKTLKNKNYYKDKMIFYSYWMSTHAFIGAKLRKKFKNSYFITRCHGYDIYEYRDKNFYLAFRKFIFKFADKILPISENGKEYMISTYSRYYVDLEKKIEVAYLGTLDYGINPKIRSKCMKIVSCSNLVDVKRVNLIIEALSFLEIPIEWIHFGDGPCAGALKKLAKERLNKKNIKYNFQGFVDNKKILMYYLKHHIDLFINVSESEGIPVSIMEAMSFGVPVIATDVGGTGEIVKNDINGFLLNKDFTINELEEKILSVYSKPEDKILELRKNARNTWEAKFNAVKNYTMFYQELEKKC